MKRVGLVLGAGGVVGHAYHAGVLAAIEEATGWDPNSAEIIVGTSAGSLVAALLRAGVSSADLARASTGKRLSGAGQRLVKMLGSAGELPVPAFQHAAIHRGPAALGLLLRPWGVRTAALAAALLPAGRVSTELVVKGIRKVYGEKWPREHTWICAVRLDDGRLVAFGRRSSPKTTMADAVAASCAIPAYFEPVVIAGSRHVDGGVHSVTNADLLASLGLDLVIVVCPMAGTRDALALGVDLPVRALVRMRLGREIAGIRRSGTEVISFLPSPKVRTAMGHNAMDPRRGPGVTAAARQSTLDHLASDGVRQRLAALAP